MNTIKRIFALVVIVAFTSVSSVAQNFQGVVEMTTTNNVTKETGQVMWYIKGASHRLDYKTSAEGKSFDYSLIITGGSTAKFVMGSGSDAVVSDIPLSSLSTTQAVTPSYLKLSTETRTIAGVLCTRVADEKNQTIAWVSDKAGLTNADIPAFIRNSGPGQTLAANNIPGIPMEIFTYDENGKLTSSQTITSIKKLSVGDDKFAAPSGRSFKEAFETGTK